MNYTKMLEFFVENRIQLNESQLKSLQESSNSNKLSQDQKKEITSSLNKNYGPKINTIVQSCLKSVADLSKYCEDSTYGEFRGFYANNDNFIAQIDLPSYAYTNKPDNKNEVHKLINKYVKDTTSFATLLKKTISAQIGQGLFTTNVRDLYNDYPSGVYKTTMLYCYDNGNYIPPFDLSVSLIATPKLIKSLTPTNDQITNIKNQNYINKFKKFNEFLKKPFRLNNSFSASDIMAICRIIGMSSDQLNSIISRNISQIGKVETINPNWFSDPDYAKSMINKIGTQYYEIEDIGGEYDLIYSIKMRKLYLLGYEHNDFCEFYKDYPFDAPEEFEDAIYFDTNMRNELAKLYKTVK